MYIGTMDFSNKSYHFLTEKGFDNQKQDEQNITENAVVVKQRLNTFLRCYGKTNKVDSGMENGENTIHYLILLLL